MTDAGYDAHGYSYLIVVVFGILGNILVIISILKQKNVLKNNYYFLVLHLAICDLGVLIIYLLNSINSHLLEELILTRTKFYCLGYLLSYGFLVSGIGMMLMISVLRYRATVHPLKPAISRRKLKVACGLVYILGLFAGYGPALPLCLMKYWEDGKIAYENYFNGYIMFFLCLFPTIFMALVYFKIGRALIKQNKYIQNICSNAAGRQSAPSSSFNILAYFRNRKTFFVCLLTVLCFAVGNILTTVWIILWIAKGYRSIMKFRWVRYCVNILRLAGSHSVNPLIYGILDKKLLKFWKLCRTRKWGSPE